MITSPPPPSLSPPSLSPSLPLWQLALIGAIEGDDKREFGVLKMISRTESQKGPE